MNRQTATARISIKPLTVPCRENEVVTLPLTQELEAETLEFLSRRPMHTVGMIGFIRDNGLVSERNRGTFYGCRNRQGQLEGVALIGHATLMETTTDRALQAFADLARQSATPHLIMGEEERISDFWNYYSEDGQDMRFACRELLLELKWPVQVREEVLEMRMATLGDIELLLPVHAQMAFEESGINPLETDPDGFRERYARRIGRGRSWVCVEEGRLIFKADVVSDTPDAVYLEGVWVSPEKMGTGYGLRCLSQLAINLLSYTKSIVLLVNDENKKAQRYYQKAGFNLRAAYDTIFLK
ncbi:MAG: GNAT family N-acetyltransferase [Pyrinomonadaceae bacterium]|nr:GNAT family N-acetyltransferase [Pyrinomonadaceae bacterium]